MNSITLSTGQGFRSTAVSNLFIDYYMPAASGAYVKVYLYLLRCVSDSDMSFSLSSAAEHLEESEKDILRALTYWEKVHVLSLTKEQGTLTGIRFLDLQPQASDSTGAAEAVQAQAPVPTAATTEATAVEAVPVYSEEQVNRLLGNKEVSWLMGIIEVYLERLLTPQDVNLVLFLYDRLGFSKELILHLYEYCIGKNKKKPEYIEKVALSWHAQGIDTVEKAEQVSLQYDTCFNAVNKAFNLGRLPGAKEREFISRWSSLKLSPVLVEEACSRTLLKLGRPDFKYADRILESWHQSGFSSLDEVKRADDAYNAAKSAPAARTDKPVSVPSMTRSAGTYNSYPQRRYSSEELLELERRLLAK